MKIWFWSWNYYKLFKNDSDRVSQKFINYFKNDNTNVIELACRNENSLDLLINNKPDLSMYKYITLHAPWYIYKNDYKTHNILWKIQNINNIYKLSNVVIHPNIVEDWEIFKNYYELPFSIENMDHRWTIRKDTNEIEKILDKHGFWLTLDLQHCFENDSTMKLSQEFQKKFDEKIVEYHISWYEKTRPHRCLHQTWQDIIIDSLLFKDRLIVIESSFDKMWEHIYELDYILEKLNK